MKFKDGDIVTDTENNEVFKFNLRTDGFAVRHRPDTFRFATDDEKQKLEASGENAVDL